MATARLFICLVLSALFTHSMGFAQDVVWDAVKGFEPWAGTRNVKISRENNLLELDITGTDSHVRTGSVLNVDSSKITQVQLEYMASDLPEKTTGEIYFIGDDGVLHGDRYWKIPSLNGDGQWHTLLVTEVAGGMDKWTKAGTIRLLRLDPVNCGQGRIIIRAIRLIDRSAYQRIAPDDEDIGYGSSAHQHLWIPGRAGKLPRIVGKGNKFDHKYRFLARFPLDTLLPGGAVKEAAIHFTISGFYGTQPQRTYLLEFLDGDVPKLLPSALTFPNVHTLRRFEVDASSVGQLIAIPVTEDINKAIENLWGSLTIRIRPEEETNGDPGASGAAVNQNTIHLEVR